MAIGEPITISYDKAPCIFTPAMVISAAVGIGLAAIFG